jgi:cyclopropane-fatty-acyl-phospholipid synthase
MSVNESLVTCLFGAADVRINGDRPWDVRVSDERFFPAVLRQGTLGFGESYMKGWWTTDDLEEVACRLSRGGLQMIAWLLPGRLIGLALALATNRQALDRSTEVADRHYNLGNDLFLSFLGEYKNYSCGYFAGTDSLDEAQRLKMERVCQALRLSPSDHLLDVGSGWGQFAHYASTHHGCRVTSINIADEQLRFARELCAGLPVEVCKCDYREVTGSYTKIAVLAMLTHVGPKNYRRFMSIMSDCLCDDGLMLIESIGGRVPKRNIEPWMEKYIFPNAVIPSLGQFDASFKGFFTRKSVSEFGQYYVLTLRAWYSNLMASWGQLSARYPDTTRLMLEYYLLASAGVFRAGHLKHWHIEFEKE